ncbi:uncharacterized protein LOC132759850 [Ruditapes philippinarum]|uniref:uncharacterized protein LOC132759850 n=1 Tax=Ruditapes philippinarum TaxID=129788 RepID=UPI00295BB20C|nr:uncharacterized protein LOC132759850 [Ruditapes philippinarum]
MPRTTYKIEVFAIDNKKNCLLFAKKITTTDLKVSLRDVCSQPGESCVECNIKWTIEDVVIPEHDDDIPGHLNESNNLYFNVICYSEGQVVHTKETIRVSSYTIPKLYPGRSYSVYVYPVYHPVTFEPAMMELTIPCTVRNERKQAKIPEASLPAKVDASEYINRLRSSLVAVEMPHIDYKPTNLKAAAKSTEIALQWTKPKHTNDKDKLEYLVTYGEYKCENTNKASSRITDLVPGQKYEIKIFTILNEIKSPPLVANVSTPPLKVSIEDVWYEPGISCVECNIKWELKDFDPPKTWNESDHLVFEIICDPGNQHVQAGNRFRDKTNSKQFKLELSPGCSYCIKVYAFYHAVRLEPPGVIELTAPCEQALLPEIHLRVSKIILCLRENVTSV